MFRRQWGRVMVSCHPLSGDPLNDTREMGEIGCAGGY